MNETCNPDDTPTVDTLQGKIALLKAGLSLSEWARRNGCNQPTAWRALHNVHCGPRANVIRRRLTAFAQQVNPQPQPQKERP